MEDRIIKPGLYAYQFRVDISNSKITKVMEFINKYEVKHYIVGAETSNQGKEHFQCVLWFSEKINTTKLRNWWNGKTTNTKQPVSLTSAKKIKNLAKYTKKDKNFITNLTEEEIVMIGEWKQKVKHSEFTDMLDKYAMKFDDKNVEEFEQSSHTTYKYNPNAVLYAFISYILDFYKANRRRPSRANLQYLAWKHGHMSNHFLINQWF